MILRVTKTRTEKVDRGNMCKSIVWNDSMEYLANHMKSIINDALTSRNFPNILYASRRKSYNKHQAF